jgi:hypothetical protein
MEKSGLSVDFYHPFAKAFLEITEDEARPICKASNVIASRTTSIS